MSHYTRLLVQVWIVIAISGFIGLTAMGWNNNEKGSPIDLLKTRIQEVTR